VTVLDERPVRATPTDEHRGARRVAVGVAVILLVTALALWRSLPATTVADHWALVWGGLDVATATAALATAVLLGAGDARAALTAVTGAALLVVDAWFDVGTASTEGAFTVALTEALVLELPLAVLAVGLALRLLRRSGRSR
jgi:hypothetical protein